MCDNIKDRFELSNFSVGVDVGILRGLKKSLDIPSLKIGLFVKELKIRTTPLIYNYLVNISDAFSTSDDSEALSELVRDKELIIKAQRMIGIVMKLREGIITKNEWFKFFCCLSGCYLYFYKTNRQINPSSYFYIKDTEVYDGEKEINIENTLCLKNKHDKCYLKFGSKENCKNWEKAIKEVVQEISLLSETIKKPQESVLDYKDSQMELSIQLDRIGVELLEEEDKKDIIKGEIEGTKIIVTTRPGDIMVTTSVSKVSLYHPKSPNYPCILLYENTKLQNENKTVVVGLFTKESPDFKAI